MNKIVRKTVALHKVFKILNEYDFEIPTGNNKQYECVICKRIASNAHQGDCGCKYCNNCIDGILNNENQFCPGTSDLCKEIPLSESNIQIDHRMNIEISKLVMKCPTKLCNYECQLIDMESHLRVCSLNKEFCPFLPFGCNYGKVNYNKMSDHLHSEVYFHSKLLVDSIGNLKNDVSELLQKRKDYEDIGNVLENNLKETKEQIKLMTEEIKHLHMQNKKISNKLEEFLQMYSMTKNKRESIFNSFQTFGNTYEVSNEDFRLSMLDNSFEEKTTTLNNNMDIENDTTLNEERSNFICANYQENNIITLNRQPSFSIGVNDKIIGNVSWCIEKVSERKKKGNWAKSNDFYSNGNQHKLGLAFWANGCGSSIGSCVTIFLRAISSRNDSTLIWPIKLIVVIRITNKYTPEISRKLVRKCDLKQPNYNSFLCSEPFDFLYSELFSLGLLKNDCLTVECAVYENS